MFILHLQIPANCRISYDLFIAFLCASVLDLITIEHRVLSNVLEGWLEAASDHDILLDELHVRRCAGGFLLLIVSGSQRRGLLLWTGQFLIVLNWNWVLPIIDSFLYVERHSETIMLAFEVLGNAFELRC